MEFLSELLKKSDEYSVLKEHITQGEVPVNVSGLTESTKAHLAASLCKNLNRSGLYVTDSEYQAKKAAADIEFFYGKNTLYYPAKEIEYYSVDAKSNEYINERLKVLEKLANTNENTLTVMSTDALLQFTIDYDSYVSSIMTIAAGQEHKIEELAKQLVDMGFSREEIVEGCGQFSIRGGILDVFTPQAENPYRIEFFGDEVDSIREFDPMSQISIEQVDSVTLSAVDEEYRASDGYPSILQYISRKSLVFMDEPHRISERADGLLWDVNETVKALLEKEVITESKEQYIHNFSETLKELLEHSLVGLYALPHSCKEYRPKANVSLTVGATNSFSGKMEFFYSDLSDWLGKNFCVLVLAGNDSKLSDLKEKLSEHEFNAIICDENTKELTPGNVYIASGALRKGFYYPQLKLAVISDEEVFGRQTKKRLRKKKPDSASKIRNFTDLDIGDYVVHQTHGIGEYVGLDTLEVDGCRKDYLKIKYNGNDFLYVPTDQLELLQKYIGKEGHVRLNKMGGAEFARQKARVKESTKELAEELLRLYSARQQAVGFAFGKDTAWQGEFEAKFPYEETEDQLRSINEVKSDMESEHPMDRLLCGDVGYGKTEVALRAAFKAVQDSKQVAYLAPTTVLTMQHYNTFVQRMKDYPIKIEMLSRFRTAKEQKQTIARLKSGETDIVIGTHRLLGKDIEFKDLGLLVVDEEQRFGVKHKERLKEIKTNVDVLTLSATPIPRTLHMSMVNIRDMSVLTQPPEERYPVQTFVMEHNMGILLDAIRRELSRGGQVYYLHNRVDSIQAAARRISEAIPDARVRFAHGQMDEDELEDIMMDMLEGEIDVLVCTTIIETGLDIPNVNTIIIEDSDRMGLSQLYQLKGRVGRSNRRAFAYLTYKPMKVLNEVAVKRLQAIREFTEFGSGFKIAMRDLEIRGAGNILGDQQHGHMDSVGYDMYCRLLSESVDELAGKPQEEVWSAVVDVNVEAYIPPKYIKNHSMRLDMYKKIASVEDNKDYMEVLDEMIDRFGEPPASVVALVDAAYVKAMAKEARFSEVTYRDGKMTLYYKSDIDFEKASALIGEYKGRILLSAGNKPYITMKLSKDEQKNPLELIKNMLQCYINLHQGKI
ncbi:MAG: transcription-repair coupling factor [Clostridia bacterium]|nr:transcription-repair coupling factor [Clostridia bacterium]